MSSITQKMIASDLSGHAQRVIRQAITAAAGFLVGRNLLTGEGAEALAPAVDAASGSVGEIVGAVAVALAAYVWSSIRAKTIRA